MADYKPDSHFFVDHSNLANSVVANLAADAYGPVSSALTNKYRTTSFVRASALTKVFAICDGQIMIQPQTGDDTKVNLILKPSVSAIYDPIKIKYFIYRGVNKEDLIGNNILKAVNTSDPNQPIFLQKLWKQFVDFNMPFYDQGIIDTPPETFPAFLIGYDENQSGDTLIEHYFKRNNDGGNLIFYQIPTCKKGEFLGNFTGRIGLDVVLDYGDYELTNQDELFKLDLTYVRKPEHIFDITAIPNSTPTKIKRYKEYIHQFLDASAFWGSHIECGEIQSVSAPNKMTTNQDVFSNILNKYQSKYKIYLYIQGERTRSYNYYDATRKVFGFDPAGQLNDTDGWPIIIEELTLPNSPTNNKHTLNIKLEFEINNNIDIDKIFELDRNISVDVISPSSSLASTYPKLERPLGVVGILNSPFNYDLSQQVDFTATFAVDSSGSSILPSGLTLNGSTGQITGSPTTSSISDVTFIATHSSGYFMKFTQTFNIQPNQINCGPITFYINGLNSCATFLFINGRLKQEFPVTDYYNELWPVNLATSLSLPSDSENLVHWLTYDRNRILNLDDVINCGAAIQNKIVFDNGSNTNLTPPTKKRRLHIASIKRNTTHNFENDNFNVSYSSAGLEKLVDNNEKYIDKVFNDKSFSFYRGKFTDGTPINSLCLVHDANFNRKSSYFMLGITEEEYNILVYDSPTVPTTPTQLLPQDAENTFFHLEEDLIFTHENIRKFKVGLWYEDNTGNISPPLYPTNDVFVYTMDGFTFFSKEFSNYEQFFKEFANAIVEFRTLMDQNSEYDYYINTSTPSTKVPRYSFNPPTSIASTVPFYTGEYGFDWLRVGDNGESSYQNSIINGYERISANDNDPNSTEYKDSAEAFKALKREYKSIPTQQENEQYFIPKLSLFSQIFSNGVSYTPQPPFQATLRILVEIHEDISKLEFDYDSTLFNLDKPILTDIQKTLDSGGNVIKVESIDQTISITCLQDFSEQKEIRVLAYPLGINDKKDAQLAGIIILNKNDVFVRKEAKIALISIHTDLNNDGTPEIAQFFPQEIINLFNSIHQNLSFCNILQSGIILDLTNDSNFKRYIDPVTSILIKGDFVNSNGGVLDYNSSTKERIHNYLRDAFLDPVLYPSNSIYSDFFLIFAFHLNQDDPGTLGHVAEIGIPLVVVYRVFNPPRDPRDLSTLNHETMHGYNLRHTHRDGSAMLSDPKQKFVYPRFNQILANGPIYINEATDNIMSYNDLAIVLWEWQKKFIRIK